MQSHCLRLGMRGARPAIRIRAQATHTSAHAAAAVALSAAAHQAWPHSQQRSPAALMTRTNVRAFYTATTAQPTVPAADDAIAAALARTLQQPPPNHAFTTGISQSCQGPLYLATDAALHTETRERCVHSRALATSAIHPEQPSFVRPISMLEEQIEWAPIEWAPKGQATQRVKRLTLRRGAQTRRQMHTQARHSNSTHTTTTQSTQEQDRKQEQQQQKQEQTNQQQQQEPQSPPRNPIWAFLGMLRRAFEWYAHKLDTHPIKTQGLTSGTLFALGDWTAQRYEVQLDSAKGIDVSDRPYIDWLRLAACTSFGLFVLGPCGHHWYSRLDVFTNRLYAPRSWKNVGLKVALDTAIFNPIFLVIFFTSVSLIEGLTLKDIGYKLYRDFVPSYAVDCSIWPPIQTINFRFVPVKFQLLVVNLGCYFDDVFLSYVQHNGMPFIFQRIEHAWLEYIGDDGSARSDHHGAKAIVASPTDEEPIREVMPHAPSTSTEDATVILVKSSQEHPHHPHSHPIHSATAGSAPGLLPHHHLVPRVLSEDTHRLPRHHGVDVALVEELDADWTDVPANGKKKQQGKDNSSNDNKDSKPSGSSSDQDSSASANKPK